MPKDVRAQRAGAQHHGGAGGAFAEALFEGDEPAEAVPVKLDEVRLERSRSFGAVWLGWMLWWALKLDELCARTFATRRESGGLGRVIAILVIGRLCEPSSELHVAEQWYRTTALEDLLGFRREHLRRAAVPSAGSVAAAQGGDRAATWCSASESCSIWTTTAALRCDEHLLRGQSPIPRLPSAATAAITAPTACR